MEPMTTEQFKKALPATVKRTINQDVIDKVNKVLADPDMYETYRENLVGYASILQDGKFKITNYIDAVKYMSHKLRNLTNQEAFSLTFPEKIKDWTARQVEPKDIASYISAYNKSKLVTKLYEQSLTPSWILNQDKYQLAINTQANLMLTAKSEKVRSDAANSLLTHLKMPETHKVELDIGLKPDSTIEALRQSTMELVAQQKRALQSGAMNAEQVAHSKVVYEVGEGEAEVVDD